MIATPGMLHFGREFTGFPEMVRDAPLEHRSAAGPPRLLDRLRSAIRTRHYSRRTERAYVGWVRRFIPFHDKRHPAGMGGPEVTRFLTHLGRGRTGERVHAGPGAERPAVPPSRSAGCGSPVAR